MATERNLWRRIRENWPGHACRIEASEGGCEPGTPDTNLSIYGKGGWVELKCWPEPLQPTQLPWHIDALQRGAACWVMCDVGDRMVWLGNAIDYARYIQQRHRPEGVSLQAALDVIRCALIGQRKGR